MLVHSLALAFVAAVSAVSSTNSGSTFAQALDLSYIARSKGKHFDAAELKHMLEAAKDEAGEGGERRELQASDQCVEEFNSIVQTPAIKEENALIGQQLQVLGSDDICISSGSVQQCFLDFNRFDHDFQTVCDDNGGQFFLADYIITCTLITTGATVFELTVDDYPGCAGQSCSESGIDAIAAFFAKISFIDPLEESGEIDCTGTFSTQVLSSGGGSGGGESGSGGDESGSGGDESGSGGDESGSGGDESGSGGDESDSEGPESSKGTDSNGGSGSESGGDGGINSANGTSGGLVACAHLSLAFVSIAAVILTWM